jgi:hypothetical protein
MALNDIKVPKENAQGTFDETVLVAATTSASGLMSSSDKTKLDGIAAGAEVNVNADWNATSGDAQILNKPSSFTPSSHAASHASTGSDPLFDQDLNQTDSVAFNELTVGGVVNFANAALNDFSFNTSVSLKDNNDYIGTVSVDADNLSANRTYTLPDASGTLALTSDIPALGTGAGEAAEGDHVHGNLTSDGKIGFTAGLPVVTTTAGAVTTLALGTAGQVLTVNSGANGVEFAAASGGGISAVGASTADVLSVSGSDLVADDGGTIDSSDPFIKWDDAAGKLVYANPLSRPTGAFYVGLAPTTTALGSNAVNIQVQRNAATNVASASNSIAIGSGGCRASATRAIAIGASNCAATGTDSIAIGNARASATYSVALSGGDNTTASGTSSVAIGDCGSDKGATGVFAVAIATGDIGNASLRAQFATRAFSAIYWSGQTTTNAATILNLDGTATNRFTIAASTALAVDILLVARRSDVADKWLVARRFLGIRRDGSNNTSLIGSVQTLGTDQSEGSPSWTFALTADDTNEALQLEVTGAASETVQWRATAFYRVA